MTNPVTQEEIPIYVADYVLMEYGTGAIMAVPAHDIRDYDFAVAYGLPIRRVVADPDDPDGELPYTGDGPMVGSGQFDGVHNRDRLRRDDRLARAARDRPGRDQLPPARLAPLPPALLGLPDPDHPLPDVRARAGPGRPVAGDPPRHRGLPAQGPLTARHRRGLGQDHLPEVRRPRHPRDRHDGHVRRLELVLPALLRRPQRLRRLGSGHPSTAGWPSTSTSAVSSTRSCI